MREEIEKPTLLLLTPGFAADENDSTCLPFLQSLIQAFNRSHPGIEILVVTLFYPEQKALYRWHNNLVLPLHGRRYGKYLRPLFWAGAIRKVKQSIQHKDMIGILSFWCQDAALIGTRVARILSVPHFIWILGQDARSANRLVKWIRPAPQQLVALSGFIQREFQTNHGILPAHILPLGIDIRLFNNDLPLERTIDLLGVGSLIQLRRHDLFLQLAARLRSAFPRLKAVLCGSGPDETSLRQTITESGLDGCVELCGQLPYRETLALMQQSKILLHPSSYEGFGQVVIEALYAGCHVISFVQADERLSSRWHVVTTFSEMYEKCEQLLRDCGPSERVLLYDIDETARRIAGLFSIQEKAS